MATFNKGLSFRFSHNKRKSSSSVLVPAIAQRKTMTPFSHQLPNVHAHEHGQPPGTKILSDLPMRGSFSHGMPTFPWDSHSFFRVEPTDDEFQTCKKMSDKDLASEILLSPPMGKVQDHNTGQHLIHYCVLTEKPQSIIAICKSPLSSEEKNVKDSHGRTPLHLAVSGELEEITRLLLELEVDSNIMDSSNLLPLHLAASIGNIAILKDLVQACDNINVRGDAGYTALHFAAAADHPKCVEFLLHEKAGLLIKSNNGTYPIHTAAKHGSARTLEAMLIAAEHIGIDRRLLLSLKDREGQLPIHSAVNNGAAEVVSVCLKYGASMLSEKDTDSTPVHYAAKQGNLTLLKIMFAFNSEMFKEAVHKTDISGRTPIHWASLFNHHEVVKYLIDLSEVNTFDTSNLTPLLSAASGGCWESLAVLLTHKHTNTDVHDPNHRNVVHQAVIQGVDLKSMLSVWKRVPNIKKLCNETDKTGSTPLHYAAWNGDVSNVTALMSLGAQVNIKNRLRQNAFHMACKNGCYDVCILLLNHTVGSSLKNEQDESGQSPLHMAAAKGYANIVNLLLQRGAIISRSKAMRTALHLAAAGDHIRCVHSILTVHLYLLNMEDIDRNTALHLAAANGHATTVNMLLRAGAEITYNNEGKCFYDDALTAGSRDVLEVCITNERWDEILSIFSHFHGQMILGLIRYLPSCCLMVLDRCVMPSSNSKSEPDYSVTYNFRHLQLGDEYAAFAKTNKFQTAPLYPIELMIEHNRDECLRHELVTIYLQQKWISYGRLVNFLDTSIYSLFLGSLTYFIVTHDPLDHYHTDGQLQRYIRVLERIRLNTTGQFIYKRQDPPGTLFSFTGWKPFDYNKPWFPTEAATTVNSPISVICLLIVCVYSASILAKSFVQFIMLGFDFLKDVLLYVNLIAHAASLYFAFPFLLGYSTHTQWGAGAIAVFLTWFNFLALWQRSSMVGLYIVMYIQIMKTLLQILFIFVVLMIAFGLVFYILMSNEDLETNVTPYLSMYRMLILLYEIDYVNTFLKPYRDDRPNTIHFPELTFFFLAIFLLFMPILLVNLMIGLAVGDIQSVMRFAHQQKLLTLVSFYAKFESRLPFLTKLTPEHLTITPNEASSTYTSWLIYLLDWKNTLDESKQSKTPFATADRIVPLAKGIDDVKRELDLVKRSIGQIMDKLGAVGENYEIKKPFDDEMLGALLNQSNDVPSTWKAFA